LLAAAVKTWLHLDRGFCVARALVAAAVASLPSLAMLAGMFESRVVAVAVVLEGKGGGDSVDKVSMPECAVLCARLELIATQ
jgi:hypothetical protein